MYLRCVCSFLTGKLPSAKGTDDYVTHCLLEGAGYCEVE